MGQLEVHPLADRTGGLRGIYAQLDFSYAVGLETVERDPFDADNTVEIDTTAWRLFLHAGFVMPAANDKVRAGVLVGFGHDRFDLATNNTLPSSRYNQVRLGVVLSFSAYGTLLQTRLDAGYRFVLGVGDLADSFGDTTSARGFDVGLSIGGTHKVGFMYGLRFGYTRYDLDFRGVAVSALGEEGNDSAVTFGLNLGWAIP